MFGSSKNAASLASRLITRIEQRATYIVPTKQRNLLKVYEPLPTAHTRTQSKNLMNSIQNELLNKYDRSGWRSQLLDKSNKDKVMRSGDVVRVSFKDGLKNPSFTGAVMAIDRNGADSTVLLRSKVTGVGVERRFSLYNPFIERVDIVRRPEKYTGRNRIYYIRNTKLDVGEYDR